MKSLNHASSIFGGLALGLVLATYAPSAHANVYATNIKLNGSLAGAASAQGSTVNISYILNEPATLGTTIQILSGATTVNTISLAAGGAGTLRGLNTVAWGGTNNSGAPVAPGAYSVSITPAAIGFTNWTQTSVDTNSGMAAFFPWGIDVDRNTNSPYYGRVVMSSSLHGNGTGAQRDGLFKMNADGTQADEGWFGNANYLTDDNNDATIAGEMPQPALFYGFNPATVRIGEDDRIYFCDSSGNGAIVACDMQATTNQIVIKPAGYASNPEASWLNYYGWGIVQFDVCGLGTTNAAVYLVDTGDFPSWGVWMWRLTNGVADPNDTIGTQVISTGSDVGTDFIVTGSGIMVDYNLDVFVSQNRSHGSDTYNRAFLYTNWNGGALPPEGGSLSYSLGTGTPPAAWAVGAGDTNLTAIWDTAINSRVNPTMVAVAMAAGEAVTGGFNGLNGGISVRSAVDGSVLATNLDVGNWYNGVAFDKVGNVYGCSRSTNLWRVWSPPSGTNQATTVAVPLLQVIQPPRITSIASASGTVTIKFTSGASDLASAFTLVSSATVAGPYAAASGAGITGSAGSFTATVATSGNAQFYKIRR